jgi:hypothetical protein
LCNFWRSVQLSPDAVAEAASWPVSEVDLTARHLWLVRWRAERNIEHLLGDPAWCDPKVAGWWVWGISCWIGGGWCFGKGPWVVGADGRITRREKGSPGEGADRKLPHLHDNGQGVNHAALREPGVGEEPEYHPMTMPELRSWLGFLSARLRHVRLVCGDWHRLVTHSASVTLSCDERHPAGVLLDPPYSHEERDTGLYSEDHPDIAAQCRAWCLEHGGDPLLRIVLCGYAGEGHEELESHGWTVEQWYRKGFLTGGYGQMGDAGDQQHRERI